MPSLSEETNGAVDMLAPGATIGIVGGGQLGRMMALAAKYMGFRVGTLDPTEDCPTAQVADFQIVADYDDTAAIRELADRSDVLTYEFENVDADALDAVRDRVAIPQGTDLLRVTQNRIAEKTFINDHGIATAPWAPVLNHAELLAALDEIGYPAVLKTAEGGYDGHGQIVLTSADDLEQVWPDDAFPTAILEGFVDFAYEASILVSGNGGDYVTFPVVRNIHCDNILHKTIMPAPMDGAMQQEARALAVELAKGFELAGTLAIELFVCADGTLIVNELAPRPHNSGHYTIEACDFDQYDLHVRGICGWPLAQPQQLTPAAVMVNVLGQHVEPTRAAIADHPEWHVHDYGKAEAKHNRKMGHITVLTDDVERTVADLDATGCWADITDRG
ncbi:5-(carboxyamino)imidazole ribonucleotide synthase [uncultured Bifidobacterium sp.]|uniref:5-(carboxyamino)imidazole ribonucleotide synthase n=1 Tax=uncultured Bifidobacterium sp. TaxID=165187 RepID=UPI00258F274E|nr:5-(carboxyamino)imidazole ribonucleotide synthase [uncultured Bifidobacterium sp.]